MTFQVADFLANKIFCILPHPASIGLKSQADRVTAREFGEWAKALPTLMAQPLWTCSNEVSPGQADLSNTDLEVTSRREWTLVAVENQSGPVPIVKSAETNLGREANLDGIAEREDGAPSLLAGRRGKRGSMHEVRSQLVLGSSSDPSFRMKYTAPAPIELEGQIPFFKKFLPSLEVIAEHSAGALPKSYLESPGSKTPIGESAVVIPPMPRIPPPAPPSFASVAGYKAIGSYLQTIDEGTRVSSPSLTYRTRVLIFPSFPLLSRSP